MRIPYKYEKKIIQEAIGKQLGVRNIDLDSPENVEKSIALLLELLELDALVQVQDTFGAPYSVKAHYDRETYEYVRFTLSPSEQSSKQQFQNAILKFQTSLIVEEVDGKVGGNKTETEKAIDNIQQLMSRIPTGFQLFVGRTGSDEAAVKAKCNLPNFWFFWKRQNTNTHGRYTTTLLGRVYSPMTEALNMIQMFTSLQKRKTNHSLGLYVATGQFSANEAHTSHSTGVESACLSSARLNAWFIVSRPVNSGVMLPKQSSI